jgi:hypothetical protein
VCGLCHIFHINTRNGDLSKIEGNVNFIVKGNVNFIGKGNVNNAPNDIRVDEVKGNVIKGGKVVTGPMARNSETTKLILNCGS